MQALRKTFMSNLRGSDMVGRWGGEEFLSICVCRNENEFQQIAEKLRSLTEATVINYKDQQLSVTISIGATMCQAGDTVKQIVLRSDKPLYKSKSNGRNRITLG